MEEGFVKVWIFSPKHRGEEKFYSLVTGGSVKGFSSCVKKLFLRGNMFNSYNSAVLYNHSIFFSCMIEIASRVVRRSAGGIYSHDSRQVLRKERSFLTLKGVLNVSTKG
jgi:hypothetical protein